MRQYLTNIGINGSILLYTPKYWVAIRKSLIMWSCDEDTIKHSLALNVLGNKSQGASLHCHLHFLFWPGSLVPKFSIMVTLTCGKKGEGSMLFFNACVDLRNSNKKRDNKLTILNTKSVKNSEIVLSVALHRVWIRSYMKRHPCR